MDNYNTITFLVIGLAGFALWTRNFSRHNALLSSLFIITVLLTLFPGFADPSAGLQLTATGIALIAVHWLLSRFLPQRWSYFPGILGTAVFLLFAHQTFVFEGYDLIFSKKDALLLPVLGAVFPVLLQWKAGLLSKWFDVDKHRADNAVNLFGIAILALLAGIFGHLYGLMLVAIGFHSTSLYLKKGESADFRFSPALASMALAGYILKISGAEAEATLQGSSLLGLFTGAGVVAWIALFEKNSYQVSFLRKLLAFIIPVILFIVFIFLGKLKEHTGGIPAFAGIVAGMGLLSFRAARPVQSVYISLLAFAIAIGMLAAPLLKPSEELSKTNPKLKALVQGSGNTEDDPSVMDVPGKKLSEAPGTWKIDSKNSKISFELGPEGTRTKGLFKIVEGTVVIGSDETQTTFNVKLPMKGFSTFNPYRDESLLSADYFNAAKYPNTTFVSKELIAKGDTYIVRGDFTMIGVTQPLEVELKLAGKGTDNGKEYLLLVGKASVDRTKHGMTPDPKMGNIVDFELEVELRK